MGSDFSKGICCVTCGRCNKEAAEEANEEISETKPILQTLGETPMCIDKQPSKPALEASKQGFEEVQSLSQDRWPLADAEEVNAETCSAAGPMGTTEGWEAAWDSTDLLVTPADGENKGEVKALTQVDNQQEEENMGNAEEKITAVSEAQPAAHAARGATLCADKGQRDDQAGAGSEGSACAGITLQERHILSFIEIVSETAAGQDCEIKPPAETRESLAGRNLPLCSLQMPEETETSLSAEHVEMGRADLAEISPQLAKSAELTSLAETAFLLGVQAAQKASKTADPSEGTANGMAEAYSTGAMPWDSFYPEGESLEPANLLLDFLEQETQSGVPAAQEMESGRCAEPAEPSAVLYQPCDGGPCEPEQEESRESDAETAASDAETAASEAELQPGIMEQTAKPPEEPPACVGVAVKQEAECLDLAPLLSEVLWSSGEIEAEDAEARET
ncbi:hypothetical protein Q9233_005083 [Columba guinea]|nr:hypothetical protein Q9233_005083 [Columba guinea]